MLPRVLLHHIEAVRPIQLIQTDADGGILRPRVADGQAPLIQVNHQRCLGLQAARHRRGIMERHLGEQHPVFSLLSPLDGSLVTPKCSVGLTQTQGTQPFHL